MKTIPAALILIIAALLVGVYFASERIKQLETTLHTTEQVRRAHSEANAAERVLDEAARIDTIRDTLYLTRTRTETLWRDLISIAPPDSVVYARLDSCMQVGAIVLQELTLCDSANTLKDSAIASYALAVAGMDSALIKTQANAVRMKKQRNWAIGAALIALIVGVI